MTPFSQRIHEALDFAAIHHRDQKRKDADVAIPYISHLFGVAYILAQHDFPEDVVVAGVLHDFIEDVVQQQWSRKWAEALDADVKAKFGANVYKLIRYVTQEKKDQHGRAIAWQLRGETYRALLCDPSTPDEARAISCADKIHNIQSLLMAFRRQPGREGKMWRKLKATPSEQIEKFRALNKGFASCWNHPLVQELELNIEELSKIASKNAQD